VACDTQEENEQVRDALREHHEKISKIEAEKSEKYQKELKERREKEMRGETTRTQFGGKHTKRTNTQFGASPWR